MLLGSGDGTEDVGVQMVEGYPALAGGGGTSEVRRTLEGQSAKGVQHCTKVGVEGSVVDIGTSAADVMPISTHTSRPSLSNLIAYLACTSIKRTM